MYEIKMLASYNKTNGIPTIIWLKTSGGVIMAATKNNTT
jgi:hypothetical protein